MSGKSDVERVSDEQSILPLFSPREWARAIGLDWWAVRKLYDDGWLSFDPERETITNGGMEAEFTFVGLLVAAGCDPDMLGRLLDGLSKPYRYRICDMYYDWQGKVWKGLPVIPTAEEFVSQHLDELEQSGDVDGLNALIGDAQYRLERLTEDEDDLPGDPGK